MWRVMIRLLVCITFLVRGYGLCANGWTGWVGLTNKPAKSNSSIVQLLESMGAVLYVKTNVP
jgi:hypothetical protein